MIPRVGEDIEEVLIVARVGIGLDASSVKLIVEGNVLGADEQSIKNNKHNNKMRNCLIFMDYFTEC